MWDSNEQSLSAKMNEMATSLYQLNAAMSRMGMGNAMPTYPPVVYPTPPVPAPTSYIPQVPQPSYVPQAGTYTRGRGGGRRGGRGQGRGRTGRGFVPAAIPPVGSHGGIPPPAHQQYQQPTPAAPYSNTTKWFANHNMCYSCGHDVPSWHTSATCPLRNIVSVRLPCIQHGIYLL